MKHSLQLKLSQHLTLTPQLQQSIRLLQLSTLELNQELETFIQDNPLLERVEGDGEFDGTDAAPVNGEASLTPAEAEAQAPVEDGAAHDEWLDGVWNDDVGGSGRDDGEEGDFPQQSAESATLREHLLWQLGLTPLSERDRVLVSMLIDALDDDGYLATPLEELIALLPPEQEVELLELETALKHVQNFDPCGVGARNLSECLALQLAPFHNATPGLAKAKLIVKQYLEVLAARDFNRLKRLLQCDDDELRTAQQLIRSLNPRPGAAYSRADTRYVVPDVVVKKVKGMWVASINSEAMPRLRINRLYADILQRQRDGSAQLSSQLQEARWLIKNVQQRFDTILRVSQAIVDRQKNFFEHGEVAMRPLVLREIADAVGLHESTISRVTTQKYMMTPRGILELKYFFGSHVATETGGACSATAIRALIKQLVSAEDRRKPLSDSQITEILSQQGIQVARRTIAKYRESLQIPSVSMRKSI